MARFVRLLRRLADVTLIALVVVVLGVVIAANAAPLFGHEMIVIRGGSMEPSIGLGALIDVVPVAPADIRPGDVVTIEEPNGVLVTHRVTRVVELPGGLYLETKGDANPTADAPLIPASAATGRVDFAMPKAGFLIFLLSQPGGVFAVFMLALTLLLAIWLLEDVEEGLAARPVLVEQEPWEDPNLDRLFGPAARKAASRRPAG